MTIYIDDLPAEALAFASITQIDTSGQPILGSAITTVNNVVPQVGSVTVRGEINWQFDLHVRVSVLAIPPDYRFGQSA
ncbi:hypothetical protein [Nocardia aurantia]|uniref:hypothetical protein n=1 Tax=Nocardia aurantia TaxID=2585199 RepID=UPI0012978107|nr:hypothetical protein [Nocardia aurantia]